MTFILATLTPEQQAVLEDAGIAVEDAPTCFLDHVCTKGTLKRIWVNKSPIELLREEIKHGRQYFGENLADL